MKCLKSNVHAGHEQQRNFWEDVINITMDHSFTFVIDQFVLHILLLKSSVWGGPFPAPLYGVTVKLKECSR